MYKYIFKVGIVLGLIAATVLSTSAVSAATLYENNKYYADGYVNQYGDFLPYDYNYYTKDGYLSQSYYGTTDNYNASLASYRYARDSRYYGTAYSNYYNNTAYRYGTGTSSYTTPYNYNYYSYPYTTGTSSYTTPYNYNYSYPYTTGTSSYTAPYNYNYSYPYTTNTTYAGYNSYLNNSDYSYYNNIYGCDYYDYACNSHRANDVSGNYTYIQYGPNRYVRSDYYNADYAAQRDQFYNSYYQYRY